MKELTLKDLETLKKKIEETHPDIKYDDIKSVCNAVEKTQKALKDIETWFDYLSAFQGENLIYGQTLESASENWNTMYDA